MEAPSMRVAGFLAHGINSKLHAQQKRHCDIYRTTLEQQLLFLIKIACSPSYFYVFQNHLAGRIKLVIGPDAARGPYV